MIIFSNPGLIDLDAAFTMGVNVKEGENPIGHFGTGLKYALATLLRDGAKITIWRGLERINITSVTKMIRGTEFKLVAANKRELGFTTDLGKEWQPWMAFRELACNALDEGGSFFSAKMADAEADQTIITVSGGGIEDAYKERHRVLVSGPALYADERIEIRPGATNLIYYRGVQVGALPKQFSHSYNILETLTLTEDRTFKSQWDVTYKLASALMQCGDKQLVEEILTCGPDFVEHGFDFPTWVEPAEAFLETARDLRADLSKGREANPAAREMARERRLASLGPDSSVELDAVDQAKLDTAKAALIEAGYRIGDYPLVIVDDLGADRLGMAKEGTMFIARRAFERGSREVAATLLEEYAHLLTKHGDATLGMQNWLFDQVLTQVERSRGSPI